MGESEMIIQLLGQARSGKDCTAEQLKTYFESQGESVEIMAYAKPMKRIVSTMFGISLEQLEEYKNNPDDFRISLEDCEDSTGMSPYEDLTDFRQILQQFGQAMKTEFGESVWTDLMKANVEKSRADVIIISDCRFNVELQAFPEAVTVRVINDSLPAPMQHASEVELIGFQTQYALNNTDKKAKTINVEFLGRCILKDFK